MHHSNQRSIFPRNQKGYGQPTRTMPSRIAGETRQFGMTIFINQLTLWMAS
jgi:hypothetical protein